VKFLSRQARSGKQSSGMEDKSTYLLLEKVRSIDDCLGVFEDSGMLEQGFLLEDAVTNLYSMCVVMRKKNMAMEPNLIGRAVIQSIVDARRAGAAALRFAGQDTDFQGLVAEADMMRDSNDFAKAEYFCWRALTLFPKHPLIYVQYAHALKEQGKIVDALVNYLNALAFGASMLDVEEHALFVAEKLEVKSQLGEWLQSAKAFLPSADIVMLHELLLGWSPQVKIILDLMMQHGSAHSIIAEIMRGDDFWHANRELLRFVAETHGV
jgi:tetratricopeptide (TPR) repeat protein